MVLNPRVQFLIADLKTHLDTDFQRSRADLVVLVIQQLLRKVNDRVLALTKAIFFNEPGNHFQFSFCDSGKTVVFGGS